MLTIKDLTASKELDSKAMAGVTGGSYIDAYRASFSAFSPVNAPSFGEQFGAAGAMTGPVSSNTVQNDNDILVNGKGGQQINYGGNSSTTNLAANAVAVDIQALIQGSF